MSLDDFFTYLFLIILIIYIAILMFAEILAMIFPKKRARRD